MYNNHHEIGNQNNDNDRIFDNVALNEIADFATDDDNYDNTIQQMQENCKDMHLMNLKSKIVDARYSNLHDLNNHIQLCSAICMH